MTYLLPNKYHDVVDDIEQLAQTITQIDTDISNLEVRTAATVETAGNIEDTIIYSDQITNGEITNIAPNRFLIVDNDGNGFTCVDGGGTSGGATGQCTIKKTDEDYDTIYGDIWSVSRDGTIPQMNSENGCANCLDIFCDESEIENAEQFPKVNSKTIQATQDFEVESNSSVILKNKIEQEEDVVELATNRNYGLIKVVSGIDVSNGTISADIITTANKNQFGYVKVGSGIEVEDGVISVTEIDVATNSTKGVIKIGEDFELNSDGEMELKDMADAQIIYKLDQIKNCENGNIDLEEQKLIYRLVIKSDLVIQINENFIPIQDYTFILELISDGTHLVAFSDQFKNGMTQLPINRGTTKLKISKKLGVPYYDVEISRLDTSDPVLLTANADVRSKFLMTAPKGGDWNPYRLLRDYYDGFSDIKEVYFEFFTLVCVDYVNYWSRSSSVAMNEFVFEGSNDGKNWTTLIYKENEVCYGKVYTERKGCFRYYKLIIGYTGDDNKLGGVMLFGTEIENNECEVINLTPYMSSNITPYATLTASSTTSGSAASLTDNDVSTYVRVTSSNNSRWIKYELAEASIANLLELNFTSTNTQANWFKLEGSNDDETWNLLLERQYPINSLFNNGYRIVFYHLMNETAYKYYKLTCLATNDSSDNWDLTGFKLFFINRGNGKPHLYSLVPTLSSNSQDGYEVTASSNYGSHYPYHAFDNSSGVDNKWLSADGDVNGAWLKIELPEATAANTFQIQSPNEGYRNRAPKKFKIQGSNDDTIWTDLISEINLSWTQNQIRKWNIENETAFKFFRILIEESNGANFVDIGEFTIGRTIREYKRYLEKSDYLVPVMSSNSQDGYVASASSVFNSDHAIWKAFDRNINSTWATQDYINPPQWLRIKLPTAKKCKILQLTSRNDKWWTQIPKDFILQGSNDGSTWTDLLTQTNVNWTEQAQTKRFNIPTSNQADYLYYRIYMTANKQSTFYAFAISEFQLINKELIQEY